MPRSRLVKLLPLVVLPVIALVLMMGGTPGAAQQGPDFGRKPIAGKRIGQTPVEAQKAPLHGGPLAVRTGRVEVMVELADPPAAQVFAQQAGISASQAAVSTRAAVARIEQAQQSTLAALRAPSINAQVIGRTQRVFNGIGISVDASAIPNIQQLPGVKSVAVLSRIHRDLANSVPFIGTPNAWTSGMGTHGEGMKIGIIDDGIDYIHTDFGGSGTGYMANNPAVVGDVPDFPSAKVPGGYDFAGDAYDPDTSPVPVPDADPMDCGGHGTHVSGIAAGYGVNSNGTTFNGPYDGSTPFSTLRIGPGVAPLASIYALKVFGCGEFTTSELMVQAIEWAVDPNGDSDFSDHLDVVNMSIGAPFGSPNDPNVAASDNAVLAGVIVVASAGNEGDTYYVAGNPSIATRAISTASSVDSTDIMDGFRVDTPPAIAGVYASRNAAAFDWSLHPVSVSGALAYPASQSSGCAPFNPANTALIAGKVALLDWTTNQCGSVTRTGNAVAAGAIGVIIAYNQPILDIAITGSALIPSTITTQATGNLLKANLGGGITVTLSSQFINSVKLVAPERNDTLSTFSSRGPRRNGSVVKPDIAAPGQSIFSAGARTGNQGRSLDGTSMASPHVTGAMALLRQLHPTWSAEELKALVMNTATHDLFSGLNHTPPTYDIGRIGAGRIDLATASGASAVAYSADDPGAVSVSFGAPEVIGSLALTRTVKVTNKGATPLSFTIGYTPSSDVPGVDFTVVGPGRGGLLTVPAGGTSTFQVGLTATAAAMKHTHDATVSPIQDSLPRHWLSEESGYVTLSATGSPLLRVPVYAAPRPASAMSTLQNSIMLAGATGPTTVQLQGTSVNTGMNYPLDVAALVSALELSYTSPDEGFSTGIVNGADLKYLGVASDYKALAAVGGDLSNAEAFFGIATHGNWSTPNEIEFDIYIDTNLDNNPDYVLFNWNFARFLSPNNDADDVFITTLCPLSPGGACTALIAEAFLNGATAGDVDTALFNSNVMVMPVFLTDMGLSGPNQRFTYQVVSFSRDADGAIDVSPVRSFDPAHPGVDTSAGIPGAPLYFDTSRTSLPLPFSTADLQTDNSQGLLLLHHHNVTGQREQVVTFTQGAPTQCPRGGCPSPTVLNNAIIDKVTPTPPPAALTAKAEAAP